MWRFRLRLLADLRNIRQINTQIVEKITSKGLDQSTPKDNTL